MIIVYKLLEGNPYSAVQSRKGHREVLGLFFARVYFWLPIVTHNFCITLHTQEEILWVWKGLLCLHALLHQPKALKWHRTMVLAKIVHRRSVSAVHPSPWSHQTDTVQQKNNKERPLKREIAKSYKRRNAITHLTQETYSRVYEWKQRNRALLLLVTSVMLFCQSISNLNFKIELCLFLSL